MVAVECLLAAEHGASNFGCISEVRDASVIDDTAPAL